MNDSNQIIYIIPKWSCLYFEKYSINIPTERMIIELLHPGCDRESANIHCLTESEIGRIPDSERKSQLNLIKHNNIVVSTIKAYLNPEDNSIFANQISNFIRAFCNENNLDSELPLYTLSVIRYMNFMFLGELLPNHQNIVDWLGKVSSIYYKDGLDGLDQLARQAETEESRGNRKSLISREYIDSSILEERFPDYRFANDYFEKFINEVNRSSDKRHSLFLLFRNGQNEIATLEKNDISSTVKQCPFCQKWFEINNFNNGKIKSSHCGEYSCKTKWESARKPKKRIGNGWHKNPDNKRRLCKECGRKRFTNQESICNECFMEIK